MTATAAGAFFSALALFSCYARYAHLDSPEGQISQNIYLHATFMFDIERLFLFGGVGLCVVAGALAIVAGITAGRHLR